MSTLLPALWDTPVSRKIASDIASVNGVFCGPAAVVWIAATWNAFHQRPYDYKSKLKDKVLFGDGPRPFRMNLPGFQGSLNSLLEKETEYELGLSPETYFTCGSIHRLVAEHQMPVIIRLPAPKLMDGLHYVTAYKSEKMWSATGKELVQLYWQDNGLFGSEKSDAGLSKSGWRHNYEMFLWGARRVIGNPDRQIAHGHTSAS